MNASMAWRLTAVCGGLLVGVGLDQAEGVDTRPGLLLVGLGVGVMAAALVRD
jgi:hypothetical protein